MISVIVPVYNVEPYLRKCLDSIINQTYRDLEILVIDDGSTDGCGAICDEYKADERVKVFHTENRGLSCARNLGLNNATGEWIGFVDSDDWIEPDMYEVLLKKAEETGADVVECGAFWEYPDRTEEQARPIMNASGGEAIQLLLCGTISTVAWDKLWKRSCFDGIRFPEGRTFEDIATTYRVFEKIGHLCTIQSCKYHYLYRIDGISNSYNIGNLIDRWISNRERKEALWNKVDDAGKKDLMRLCCVAAARAWAHLWECSANDREEYEDKIREMYIFTKENIPLFGYKSWNITLRVGMFFPHFMNRLSLRSACWINHLRRKICH